ncbi:MAG: hypothetical protein GY822_14105 [Deltaproteobacteria bacterium]|nr:hypothetical protein [Deltaproteobacteria bacterium]
MAVTQINTNLEAASLLQEVAEIDYQAGRLNKAHAMAKASLRMNPKNTLCQDTLALIEGAMVAV